jgi:hypothetical protein
MSKIDTYRHMLRDLHDWVPFLRKESGLPGPRGNLELAYAVAEEGSKKQFEQLMSVNAEENTPDVFLVFCGVVGLGKLSGRDPELFERLRQSASDPRWRVREAVATGLQLAGDQNMGQLLREMKKWSRGNWYEKRAAAAALAEPRLLQQPKLVKQALVILDKITASMEEADEPRGEAFQALRKGMGYCWSVAVAALPQDGKPSMENWLTSRDKDVRWVMRENLKKTRLIRMDARWVRACTKKLERASKV